MIYVWQRDTTGQPFGFNLINNNPRVSSTKFTHDIAKGNAPTYTSILINSAVYNNSITEETVWSENILYDWAGIDAAVGIVQISSTDVNDTLAGTGARTCTIQGLDITGVQQSETLSLNGQTPVMSAFSYSRITKITCDSAGTLQKNVGKIYVGTGVVNVGVPTVVWASVSIGKNQSLMGTWTVPAIRNLYITSITTTTNSNKGNEITIYSRNQNGIFRPKISSFLFSTGTQQILELPLLFTANTDIDIRSTAQAVGSDISVSLEGWLEM